jgi:hypothetical protein
MITDADGEHTFDVTNGEPGADGFSPVATVTQTQTGATISITDKSGTTTAQISNGAKGDPGDDYVLTAQDKAEIAQQAEELLAPVLDDKAPIIVAAAGPAAIVSFPDGADGMPVKSLTVNIEPVQSGSGDPSPDNIRPITGWTGVNVTVSPTTDAEDGRTHSIAFPSEAGTVYGGTLDAVSGELVLTHKYLSDNGSLGWIRNADGSFYVRNPSDQAVQDSDGCLCNYAPFNISFSGMNVFFRTNGLISLGTGWGAVYPSADELKNAFASVPIQFVYKLATPITYTLTPTEIRTLLGQNNIWADTGDVEVEYHADTKTYVDSKEPEIPVQDVQVNGTSILNAQGVANVPLASASEFGATKYATAGEIKNGNGAGRSINPARQDASVFYGLTKAAGVDMASSANPVGTYTDAAKIAIRKMLGIPNQEWEKIGEYTVSENTALFEITTDSNGQPFKLSQMLIKVWLEASTTGTRDCISATGLVVTDDNVNMSIPSTTKRYLTNTGSACYMQYELWIKGGNSISNGFVASVPNSTQPVEQINYYNDDIKYYRGFRLSQYSATQTPIPAGTVIKLYGIRYDE